MSPQNKKWTWDEIIALIFAICGIIATLTLFILGEFQPNLKEEVGEIFAGIATIISGGYTTIKQLIKNMPKQ